MRELACPICAIQIRGPFAPAPESPLARLSPELAAFLHLFVTSRGNLSDVERTLGVSYQTVRAKLDELIAALQDGAAAAPPGGRGAPPAAPQTPREGETSRRDRKAVLEGVAAGRLSPQEALERLRRLPPRPEKEQD